MIILETTFPENYRKDDIKQILSYVTTGKFCQIICIPGAGKATILRLLAHNRNVLKYHLQEKEASLRFIYLNFLELTNYDEASIAKFILLAMDLNFPESSDPIVLTKLLKETVNEMADSGQNLVFLFDHFDEYQNRLPRSFFQMLKSASSLAKYKFSAVFATRRDLAQLVDEQIAKDFWGFFVGNTIYLKVYDRQGADLLLSQIQKVLDKKLTPSQKTQIVKLTGGHAKLTKIVAELALRENIDITEERLLQNESVRASLLELWQFLTAEEQHVLYHFSQDDANIEPEVIEGPTKLDILKNSNQQSPPASQGKALRAGSNSKTPARLVSDSVAGRQAIQPASRGEQYTFSIPLFEAFVKTSIKDTSAHKISFDESTKEIRKGESIISELLSSQELRLMRFLVKNPSRIIDRDELIEAVWPHTQVAQAVSDEAIDQMVFRLRKKIEDEPSNPKHIITLKGRGFRFEP